MCVCVCVCVHLLICLKEAPLTLFKQGRFLEHSASFPTSYTSFRVISVCLVNARVAAWWAQWGLVVLESD